MLEANLPPPRKYLTKVGEAINQKDRRNQVPFFLAAAAKNTDLCLALVKHPDFDWLVFDKGRTVLMAAVDVGTKEDNRLLEYMFLGNNFNRLFPRAVDDSWDVNAAKEKRVTAMGSTAMHLAIKKNCVHAVEMMVRHCGRDWSGIWRIVMSLKNDSSPTIFENHCYFFGCDFRFRGWVWICDKLCDSSMVVDCICRHVEWRFRLSRVFIWPGICRTPAVLDMFVFSSAESGTGARSGTWGIVMSLKNDSSPRR